MNNNTIIAQVDKICDAIRQGGGANIQWEQLTTQGTHIANIIVDGSTIRVFAPTGGGGGGGSIVEWNQRETTGQHIADITIDGNTTEVYAPTGGGGITFDELYNGTSPVGGNITLLHPISDYDIILIEMIQTAYPTTKIGSTFYTVATMQNTANYFYPYYGALGYCDFQYINDTTFYFPREGGVHVSKIFGLKF